MASVYCAVCSIPFRPGEAFSLMDCHVVHKYCVGQKTMHQRSLDDIRDRVRRLDDEIAQERALWNAQAQGYQRDYDLAQARARTARRQQQRAEERAAELADEVTRLNRDFVVPRLNPPLSTPPMPVATPVAATPEPEQISAPEEDGTAIRFGLLELD